MTTLAPRRAQSPTRRKRHTASAAVLAATVALAISGCQSVSQVDQATLLGGAVGAGLGAVTAAALGASAGWVVVAGAAGATAGALFARNAALSQCAISNGDGTYRIVRC
ncbi:MAG: bacteriocin [Devosiaceae bacterium]|nr:bacteriocin [Devosiaceae bacterium MH13]